MNENKPTADGHAQRRRRVLRGAISAPVVLTISSGASATMTSNRRCVANQVNGVTTTMPRTHVPGTSVPSTVIRVKLHRVGAGTKRYVSGTELRSLAHTSQTTLWLDTGKWQELSVAGATSNSLVGSVGTPSELGLTATPTVTSPIEYATVQIDQHGHVVSVGKDSGSTSMMAATCWNSFRAGPL